MRNLIDALWRQLRGLLPLLALVTIILFAVGMAHGKSVPTEPPWHFRRAPGLSRSQQCDTAGFSP
jgi:hypothetical protein